MKIEPVNKLITKYIKENEVFTLATSRNNIPYTALCFYAYNQKENYFVFTSSHATKHVNDFLIQPKVAGSIYKKTSAVNLIKGLQFTGEITLNIEENENKKIENLYLKNFPFALAMELNLWILKPYFFKLTDNSLGFGKKIIWQTNQIKIV